MIYEGSVIHFEGMNEDFSQPMMQLLFKSHHTKCNN